MGTLSKLFTLKSTPVESEEKIISDYLDDNDEVQVRITYYQTGYGAAQKALGNPTIFRACLENVYASFEEQCRKLKEEQQKLKQPYVDEKGRLESEFKNNETALSINEDKLEAANKKIDIIKHDIANVKNKPGDYGVTDTKKPHALFYIGLILLFPITIYLFVFYISATYSAFFKIFSDDSLSTAIFDAQAFNKAMQEGWLEGVLVITIPSVFLGLGFIIHMAQKGKGLKNVIRILSLFILTFLFDGLLAYQIEKKIYEFKKTLETPIYNLKIALGEAEFWMIIFAGFVVYIIWGLLFDLVMKEYENIDKIKTFIRTKDHELIRVEETKNNIINDCNSIKQRLTEIKGKIAEHQNRIDGFIFNVKQYLLYHNQYKEGWLQAVQAELIIPPDKRERIISDCEQIANSHLEGLDLLKPDHQHIIYSKTY